MEHTEAYNEKKEAQKEAHKEQQAHKDAFVPHPTRGEGKHDDARHPKYKVGDTVKTPDGDGVVASLMRVTPEGTVIEDNSNRVDYVTKFTVRLGSGQNKVYEAADLNKGHHKEIDNADERAEKREDAKDAKEAKEAREAKE